MPVKAIKTRLSCLWYCRSWKWPFQKREQKCNPVNKRWIIDHTALQSTIFEGLKIDSIIFLRVNPYFYGSESSRTKFFRKRNSSHHNTATYLFWYTINNFDNTLVSSDKKLLREGIWNDHKRQYRRAAVRASLHHCFILMQHFISPYLGWRRNGLIKSKLP